ncbi:cell cycle checkpoint protein RAD1-like isoform X1 [Thrips palmi]|uniref:Cell cycle checkpoint protein RAD1-like isoform X1 n=1 Tax=Thrips palmi TaxID=161013 RepID=A0A6P8YDW4_THRPL|nr:cell cycle checkpoint protein RAD1-like isoform X1 [Thrips palmi]
MFVQERENDENCLLIAKIDNVKNINSIIKALNFSQEAVCFCSEDGLKVTVEIAKCVQASAFIQLDIFQEYSFNAEEQLIFKIDFHTLVECLNMFEASGMSATVDMRMQGQGQPLLLMLEEDGVILDSSIRTQDPGEIADFSFGDDSVINKIILRSEFLKEILDELDTTSEFIGIELSGSYPFFRFFMSSRLGESEYQIEKTSDMIEHFDCKVRTAFRYRSEHLKHTIKAIAVSQKVSLRMDEKGLLCFQCMMKMDDGQICFVEFFCIQATNEDGGLAVIEPADEYTLPEPF